MKKYAGLIQFQKSIEKALSSTQQIPQALQRIASTYSTIKNDLLLCTPFRIEPIPTDSLRYSIYYQDGINMSKMSIMISHINYDAYLWTDCGQWYLDDYYSDIKEIAIKMSEAPVFQRVPENIRELYSLIKEGYWEFDGNSMPYFDGLAPDDCDEVLSWDKRYILTGTDAKNMSIVKRDEWDKICKREKNWFKTNDK